MRVTIFCHSLISDWNHGNAHFLRGVAMALLDRGHVVDVYEPMDSWSRKNLLQDHGRDATRQFYDAYPRLSPILYHPDHLDLERALSSTSLVLVHEWNSPELVRRIGEHRLRHSHYRLLFHDTHHRMVTDPESMARFDLRHYDGVLAFGEVLSELYRSRNLANRVWTWHEAADLTRFRPAPARKSRKDGDLVWIGNWGDDERSEELREFLMEPVRELNLRANVHGVRYPKAAQERLRSSGIEYRGWVANFKVPELFARHSTTVHVPRRPYAKALPGIPTIRMFEALACGIPLVSAPWSDSEGLFRPGTDYLVARDGQEMKKHLKFLLNEPSAANEIAKRGFETVQSRHTCNHRVDELFSIYKELTR